MIELYQKIKESINIPKSKIGIAFSGGVDSSLISKICVDMNYDVTLLTIGFPKSHDILFAKKVNETFGLPHYTSDIDDSFGEVCRKISKLINTDNISWNENCIAFYYIAKLAKSIGIDVVVTANGIDELFCGYNMYREIFPKGEQEILDVMNKKIDNEIKMMKSVNLVCLEFGVKVIQPLLSSDFIEYAKKIPINEKIHGSNDLLRKHIIREMACDIGVPKISYRKRKKALQYGSQIHKNFLKIK